MVRLYLVARIAFAAITILVPGFVSGQDYPSKPIRIITAVAGGGGDFTTRQIAQGITGPLGQPVIVDNRTAFLAAEVVSKSPPDGYTLTVSGGSVWIIPLLRKAPYDIANDFSPVALISREVNVLVVHPSVPAKSVQELVALAKAKPGALNYASPGTGTTQHLAMEYFKSLGSVNILHVPYKGGPPGITALISGEVQLMIFDAGVVAPHAKSGKLRALAATSAQPSALAPGLPTVAASGLPGFESVSMTGMFAPVKTPDVIIRRLNQEIVRVLNLPDVKEKFFNAGIEIVGGSPEQFAAAVKSEMANLGKVIRDAGIKAD